MTLVEIAKHFRDQAASCGRYDEMSKSQIINGYCDAHDAGNKELANGFYAAIMLRYWYKIYEWRENSASLHLDDEEFIEWLHDAVWYAVNHRPWRDETKSIYNDLDGPDKAIQACCGSMRGMAYQYFNKDKRRGNVQLYSLDSTVEENGDSALAYVGAVSTDSVNNGGAKSVIEQFLSSGKYIEALIVDGIINGDAFKEETNVVTYESYSQAIAANGAEPSVPQMVSVKVKSDVYDDRKLVKHLNRIDGKYMLYYFCSEYDITLDTAETILSTLKKMSNTKLYKMIEKTKIEIKSSPEMLSMLIA